MYFAQPVAATSNVCCVALNSEIVPKIHNFAVRHPIHKSKMF